MIKTTLDKPMTIRQYEQHCLTQWGAHQKAWREFNGNPNRDNAIEPDEARPNERIGYLIKAHGSIEKAMAELLLAVLDDRADDETRADCYHLAYTIRICRTR